MTLEEIKTKSIDEKADLLKQLSRGEGKRFWFLCSRGVPAAGMKKVSDYVEPIVWSTMLKK